MLNDIPHMGLYYPKIWRQMRSAYQTRKAVRMERLGRSMIVTMILATTLRYVCPTPNLLNSPQASYDAQKLPSVLLWLFEDISGSGAAVVGSALILSLHRAPAAMRTGTAPQCLCSHTCRGFPTTTTTTTTTASTPPAATNIRIRSC